MARRTTRRLFTIYMILATFSNVSASSSALRAAEEVGLLPRQNGGCETSGYNACNKPGLPDNFCCPAGDTCFVFNDNKSLLCCPPNKDCSSISTISCDLSLQNVTAHPISPLITTDLDAKMDTCGDKCCPVGMSCSNGNQCAVDAAAAASSISAAAAASSTVAAETSSAATSLSTQSSSPTVSSAVPSDTQTSTSSSQGAVSVNADTHCDRFPTTAILVGFFSGLAAGIIMTVILICCVGRSSKKSQHDLDKRPHSDFSSVTANVSDPIYQPGANGRTDFLRRDSKTKYYASSTHSRVRSFFSRTPTLRTLRRSPSASEEVVAGRNGGAFATGGQKMTGRSKRSNTTNTVSSLSSSTSGPPKTPKTPSTLRKEPSMESIKIYSPPNIHGGPGDERMTTFREMMAEAGFKEGAPYLGSPGRVDPRSRRIGEV